MQVFTNITKLLLAFIVSLLLTHFCSLSVSVYAQAKKQLGKAVPATNNSAPEEVKFNYDTNILIGSEEPAPIPVGGGIDLDLIEAEDLEEMPSFNDSAAQQDLDGMPIKLSMDEAVEARKKAVEPKEVVIESRALINKLLDLSAIEDTEAKGRAVMDALSSHTPYINKYKIVEEVVKFEGNTAIDSLTDGELKERLSLLPTVIRMDYNPLVRRFIDLYINSKEEQLKRMLTKSSLYFPIFEEVLDRYGMPIELKYLPVVQTALIPNAQASDGRSGLWLLDYEVARSNGLISTSYIDERRDPQLGTEVAVKQLRKLYFRYQDWYLAIAAFVAGEGAVEKAIRRSGTDTKSKNKDYWKIESFLPKETRVYVPLFIAANYAMNYYKKHGIQVGNAPYNLYATDTVHVKREVQLSDISAFINMPLKEIKFLNPALLKEVIPATSEGFGYPMVLPTFKIGLFEMYLRNLSAAEMDIVIDNKKPVELPLDNPLNYEMDDYNIILTASKEYSDNRTSIVRAEQVASVAAKATKAAAAIAKAEAAKEVADEIVKNATVGTMDVKKAETAVENAEEAVKEAKVVNKSLQDAERVKKTIEKPKTAIINPSTDKIDYTVQMGETMKDIAKRYNCKVEDILRWNKLTVETVEEGMRLKLILLPDMDDELMRNYILNTSGKLLTNKKYIKPEAPKVETELTKKVISGEEIYVVRKGEKLHEIAKKFNITSSKIMRYNNLTNSNLKTNQALKIPVFEAR